MVGTLLVVDASASMDFPRGDASKRAYAGQVAIALAQVAHQSGDPVGLIVGDRTVPARTRRGIVAQIAHALDAPVTADRLSAALSRIPLPPRVVILSDFLDDDAALLRLATAHEAQGAEVLAIEVIARDELDPPNAPFNAVDPERPDSPRPYARGVRDLYRARFEAWRQETARQWRRVGARWIDVVTDEPLAGAVRRIVAP